MLYVLALVSLGVALALGALDLLGVTPGAAGAVNVALLMTLVFLGAKALLNHGHHHHRHSHR